MGYGLCLSSYNFDYPGSWLWKSGGSKPHRVLITRDNLFLTQPPSWNAASGPIWGSASFILLKGTLTCGQGSALRETAFAFSVLIPQFWCSPIEHLYLRPADPTLGKSRNQIFVLPSFTHIYSTWGINECEAPRFEMLTALSLFADKTGDRCKGWVVF